MPPKKKASEAAAPSAPSPPPLEQTADGEDAGGRTGVDEEAHSAARSKDKVALPIGGVAGSHNDRAHSKTSAFVHAPRPSQEAWDRQRYGTHGTMRLLDQDRAGGSRSAQDQHARQHAGTSEARSPGWDTAPSNVVRSPSMSRSSHRSHCRPPLEQKLWRKLNCSWITFQQQTRSMNGGPPFRVSSASPTATLHGGRVHRSRGKTAMHEPMGVQPPCTPRPEGQDR